MIEHWLPCPGMEETHEVSSLGGLRSWLRPGSARARLTHPKRIRGSVSSTGYLLLWTPEGNKAVHRLVCEAFHGQAPSDLHVVRHLNGDRLDNRAINLRWGTMSENMADARQHGTLGVGERNSGAKLTEARVREIKSRLRPIRGNRAALAREFGVSASIVENIANGKNWAHVTLDPTLIREGVES